MTGLGRGRERSIGARQTLLATGLLVCSACGQPSWPKPTPWPVPDAVGESGSGVLLPDTPAPPTPDPDDQSRGLLAAKARQARFERERVSLEALAKSGDSAQIEFRWLRAGDETELSVRLGTAPGAQVDQVAIRCVATPQEVSVHPGSTGDSDPVPLPAPTQTRTALAQPAIRAWVVASSILVVRSVTPVAPRARTTAVVCEALSGAPVFEAEPPGSVLTRSTLQPGQAHYADEIAVVGDTGQPHATSISCAEQVDSVIRQRERVEISPERGAWVRNRLTLLGGGGVMFEQRSRLRLVSCGF